MLHKRANILFVICILGLAFLTFSQTQFIYVGTITYICTASQTHTASYYETKPEENARQVACGDRSTNQKPMTTANKKRNEPRTTHISHKFTQNSERVLLDGCNMGKTRNSRLETTPKSTPHVQAVR